MHPPGVPPTCSISCSPPTYSSLILTCYRVWWICWYRWVCWSSWLRWSSWSSWLSNSPIRRTDTTRETTVSCHIVLQKDHILAMNIAFNCIIFMKWSQICSGKHVLHNNNYVREWSLFTAGGQWKRGWT